MCRVFDMFKVEVPVVFSGTEGFPPRRDGRYSTVHRTPYKRPNLSETMHHNTSLVTEHHKRRPNAVNATICGPRCLAWTPSPAPLRHDAAS